MGKYTFSWEHAAREVLVTGTFDDWQKTVTLDEADGLFTKTVELPKVYTQYKFVVDGKWVVNDTARKEDDGHGIVNNVLLPEDIVDEPVDTLSSVAPTATTAALAAAVPKETPTSSDSLPGAFPMTPPADTPLSEAQTFHVAPIPATPGLGNPVHLAPGEPVPDPATLTDNTVQSTVGSDKDGPEPDAQTFGVAPIPATPGLGNPIHLAPGEPVPDPATLTDNTVQSTVKTDAASYAKSDALPTLPDLALTPQAERDAKGGMFGLPPVMGNMIPESGLPMGAQEAHAEHDPGVTIQSVGPTSTTAALAAQVPKEPRSVPEMVNASRKEAGFAPEATSNPIAVMDKKEVEHELKEEVPQAPAAADNSYASQAKEAAGVAAATVAAGAAAGAGLFAAATYAAKDKAAELTGLNSAATASSNEVPSVVSESQKEAHSSPGALANPEAVHDKSQVEQELLSEIPKTNETGAAAPAIAIPAVVAESQKEAHATPGAAANTEAVAEKKAVEAELLSEIPKTNEAGEPAPVLSAATATTAPSATTTGDVAPNVPDVVAESHQEAHASPEAASNVEAVGGKKAVEAELLEEVNKADATGESAPAISRNEGAALSDEALVDTKPLTSSSEPDALNAPASSQAQAVQPVPFTAVEPTTDASSSVPKETEAVEPATTEQTSPVVTTGTETSTTEPTSGTTPATTTEATSSTALAPPAKVDRKDSDVSPKGTPGSQSIASGPDDKKKKRRSLFGKIKDKLSSKH
ncbi:Cruciform DNA binding protein [Pleosporales sp. CAS-2024a]